MQEEGNRFKKTKIFLGFVIVIAILARLMNFGWNTIALCCLIAPQIWAFYSINLKVSKYASQKAYILFLISISSLTFLVPYILYPDFGDVGGPYAVLGLVKDRQIMPMLENISKGMGVFNFILLAIELSIYFALKKKENK